MNKLDIILEELDVLVNEAFNHENTDPDILLSCEKSVKAALKEWAAIKAIGEA